MKAEAIAHVRAMRPFPAPATPEDMNQAKEAGFRQIFARLIALFAEIDRPSLRVRMAASLALTIVAKILGVFAPLALAAAINHLAAQNGHGNFWLFLGLWTLLGLGGRLAPILRDIIFQPVSQEAQRRLGVSVFGHVQHLSMGFHQSKRTGGLWRILERGVRAIDFLVRFLVFNIGPSLFELALAGGILWWRYGPLYSLIAVVTVGFYAAATIALTNWRTKHRRDMNDADSEATARAVDSLTNFETVKAFSGEERETENYDHALRTYNRAAVKSNTSLQVLNGMQATIQSLGVLALMALAGLSVGKAFGFGGKQLGPGDITAIMLIMLNIYAPLNILGFAWREIRQCGIDMEAMYDLLAQKPDVVDVENAPDLKVPAGALTFEHVGFQHPGRMAGIEDINVDLPAGSSLAIVGPSGAGKSTLIRLLFRFYDPESGRILIDGQDIATVKQTSLRASIGLVAQDVVLFNASLRDNIAYGKPDATDAEIDRVVLLARLDKLLANAPEGLATKVGERGLKLSGGERQRVGIARALLKNPPILVLDEATSALDSRTEDEVRLAFADAAQGRTTIMIAHRLSTIAHADQIIVLDKGLIVARGRHEALLGQGGLYADLWARQALMA